MTAESTLRRGAERLRNRRKVPLAQPVVGAKLADLLDQIVLDDNDAHLSVETTDAALALARSILRETGESE